MNGYDRCFKGGCKEMNSGLPIGIWNCCEGGAELSRGGGGQNPEVGDF